MSVWSTVTKKPRTGSFSSRMALTDSKGEDVTPSKVTLIVIEGTGSGSYDFGAEVSLDILQDYNTFLYWEYVWPGINLIDTDTKLTLAITERQPKIILPKEDEFKILVEQQKLNPGLIPADQQGKVIVKAYYGIKSMAWCYGTNYNSQFALGNQPYRTVPFVQPCLYYDIPQGVIIDVGFVREANKPESESSTVDMKQAMVMIRSDNRLYLCSEKYAFEMDSDLLRDLGVRLKVLPDLPSDFVARKVLQGHNGYVFISGWKLNSDGEKIGNDMIAFHTYVPYRGMTYILDAMDRFVDTKDGYPLFEKTFYRVNEKILYAIDSDGAYWALGENKLYKGLIGTVGATENNRGPIYTKLTKIHDGPFHTIQMSEGRTYFIGEEIYACGDNSGGKLGIGEETLGSSNPGMDYIKVQYSMSRLWGAIYSNNIIGFITDDSSYTLAFSDDNKIFICGNMNNRDDTLGINHEVLKHLVDVVYYKHHGDLDGRKFLKRISFMCFFLQEWFCIYDADDDYFSYPFVIGDNEVEWVSDDTTISNYFPSNKIPDYEIPIMYEFVPVSYASPGTPEALEYGPFDLFYNFKLFKAIQPDSGKREYKNFSWNPTFSTSSKKVVDEEVSFSGDPETYYHEQYEVEFAWGSSFESSEAFKTLDHNNVVWPFQVTNLKRFTVNNRDSYETYPAFFLLTDPLPNFRSDSRFKMTDEI